MTLLAQLAGDLGTVLQVGILGAVVGSWIHLSSRVARVETKVEDLPCKTGASCAVPVHHQTAKA